MNKKAIKIFIYLVVLLFCILIFRTCICPNWNFFSEHSVNSDELKRRKELNKKEYLKLFNNEIQKKIKSYDNDMIKSKYSYLNLTYMNKYHILIHKVMIKSQLPVNQLVVIDNIKLDLTSNVVYAGFELDDIMFRYSHEYDSIVRTIFISSDEKNISQLNYGDSITSYNLIGKTITFRFDLNGTVDMFFSSSKRGIANVTIYKKGDFVYIISIFPREEGLEMGSQLTKELLNIN